MAEDLAAMVDDAVDEKAVIHHQVDRIYHKLALFMASHYGGLPYCVQVMDGGRAEIIPLA
jgi:hypothetical protein